MDRKFYQKSKAGWFVLFFVAIISIIVAFVYKQSNQSVEQESDQNTQQQYDEAPASAFINLEDFLIPSTLSHQVYAKTDPIKGIYLTGNSAGNQKVDELIKVANETEVNAFVIDVKNDSGHLTFDMDIPLADEIGAEYPSIKDIDVLMDKLYDNNIYPIARIVCFKDPYLSYHNQDYAIKNQDGSLFYYNNVSWLNPYYKNAWKYIVDVSKEAAKAGFKEIQYDYIRFEATYRLENADFGPIDENKTRMDIIVDFLDYANKELEDYDVVLSADVFGTIITSEVDAKMIGQDYVEMAKRLDVICPMVYPSHYGRGYYGIPYSESPDFYPYVIIKGAMEDSNERLTEINNDEDRPIVRPWLQAFTASYLPDGDCMTYGGQEIRDQIQATYDAGLEEWILWNAGNNYNISGLLKESEVENE